MARTGGSREALIRQLAQRNGLDPEAVIADSKGEGRSALYGGNSVGDHGTSFGAFQLHAGGALPAAVWARGPAYANKWANSLAGLTYAVQRMASVAKGLQGHDALAAIVSKFERPSDIPGEIEKRWGYYGQGGGGGSSPAQGRALTSVGAAAASNPLAGPDPRAVIVETLLRASSQAVSGQTPDFSGILQIAQARQQAQAAQEQFGPNGQQTGPLDPTSTPGNFGGKVKFVGDTQGVNPRFLSKVARAASYAGATQIRVISGYRSPAHNKAVGGAPNSNHMRGEALDSEALVNGQWVPTGTLLRNTAPKFGLRSGDQPGFFHGQPDPNHVDGG
jgi:hypothetical protein